MARTVVRRENIRTQQWHLPGIERALKFRPLLLLSRGIDFSARNPLSQSPLE